MRILFCPAELPNAQDGASNAMREAGHVIFEMPAISADALGEIERAYPAGPPKTARSHGLRPCIARCVDAGNIEVVVARGEDCDAYAFFQEARTRAPYNRLVLVSCLDSLNLQAFQENLEFPDRAQSDDLASQRQMWRLSDVVIAPSRRAANVARGLGVENRIEVVPPPFRFEDRPGSAHFSTRLVRVGPIAMGRGLDAAALLANQIGDELGIEDIGLIGADMGATLRDARAVDVFARRLRLDKEATLIATGPISDDDALDLLHPSDALFAHDPSSAFDYFTLRALGRGLFPLTLAGSILAELFPKTLSECLLPADLTNRGGLLAALSAIRREKSLKTAQLRDAIGLALRPDVYAARMTAILSELLAAKSARRDQRATTRPSTSILMAACDPPEAFAAALASLSRQTLPPDRIVICDDGSRAGLGEWAEFARSLNIAPTIVKQRNLGLAGARNTLIDACDTDLALFLDCDDLLDDSALERLVAAFQAADSPDAIIPGRRNFGESQEIVLRQMLGDHLHVLRNEYRMTALIKTSVLREIRFPAMHRDGEADDWIFWLNFNARGFRAEFVPEPLFHYRFVSGSMSWPWSTGQAAATAAMIAVAACAPAFARGSWRTRWSVFEFHGFLHALSP